MPEKCPGDFLEGVEDMSLPAQIVKKFKSLAEQCGGDKILMSPEQLKRVGDGIIKNMAESIAEGKKWGKVRRKYGEHK